MAVFFDPNQMYNAFSQGAQIGGGIRKNETQAKLAPMIAAGDYKGANAFAASRGDLEMMDYLRPMAKEADDEAWNKKYGGMLAAGDYKGAAALGFADGKIEQALGAREYGRALKADEITDYRTGLEFLDSNAEEVMKNYTPEQRKDEYIRRVAASPFGQDPNIMQALERAGADGTITDDEVISFRRELMTAGERQNQQNWQTSFDYNAGQNKQTQSNWERQFAADQAETASQSLPPSGLTEDQMKMEIDLANRWAPIQKNYEDIRAQYGRITTLGAQLRPNGEPFDPAQQAVNDLALVVAFTKMLDPGSVAREGEVELTKKSASLLGEASTWLPRLEKGGTLLPAATRKALVQAATDMMPVYDDAYENMADQNYSRVTAYGLEPERVMLGYEWSSDEPEETFKGGQDTPKPPPGLPPEVVDLWEDMTPDERARWSKPAMPGGGVGFRTNF